MLEIALGIVLGYILLNLGWLALMAVVRFFQFAWLFPPKSKSYKEIEEEMIRNERAGRNRY
jgi:hypothetical protein